MGRVVKKLKKDTIYMNLHVKNVKEKELYKPINVKAVKDLVYNQIISWNLSKFQEE